MLRSEMSVVLKIQLQQLPLLKEEAIPNSSLIQEETKELEFTTCMVTRAVQWMVRCFPSITILASPCLISWIHRVETKEGVHQRWQGNLGLLDPPRLLELLQRFSVVRRLKILLRNWSLTRISAEQARPLVVFGLGKMNLRCLKTSNWISTSYARPDLKNVTSNLQYQLCLVQTVVWTSLSNVNRSRET